MAPISRLRVGAEAAVRLRVSGRVSGSEPRIGIDDFIGRPADHVPMFRQLAVADSNDLGNCHLWRSSDPRYSGRARTQDRPRRWREQLPIWAAASGQSACSRKQLYPPPCRRQYPECVGRAGLKPRGVAVLILVVLIQLPPETGEDLFLYYNAGLVHERVLQPPVTCPPG